MNIGLYTLTSPLHDENAVNAASAGTISSNPLSATTMSYS